jgi:hypothetical protein
MSALSAAPASVSMGAPALLGTGEGLPVSLRKLVTGPILAKKLALQQGRRRSAGQGKRQVTVS